MENRTFGGLRALAAFLEERIAGEALELEGAAEATSHLLYDRVRATFGDKSQLAALAEATQAERVSKGFTPDEPLLRDGELLRESVERIHEGQIGGAGSNEPVMLYHEMGYMNARTGEPVPPRPVFQLSLHGSEPEVETIIEAAVDGLLGGRG